MTTPSQTTDPATAQRTSRAAVRQVLQQHAAPKSRLSFGPVAECVELLAAQKAGRQQALAHAGAAEGLVTSGEDAPHLPEPSGAQAAPEMVLRRVKFRPTTQTTSLFAQLQAISAQRESETKLASFIKRVRQQLQMEARERELHAKQSEIKANKGSAKNQLVGTALSFGLSVGAAAKFGFQDPGLSQFVSGAFSFYDKTFGSAAEANEAQVEQKRQANSAQREQMAVDLMNPWFDRSDEARKNALKALEAYVQRKVEASNALAR